jgi:hypothetical protein
MPAHIPDKVVPTGYLPTRTGSVPYAVSWNPAQNPYGESGSEKTPTTITAKIQCNWNESSLFADFAKGFARVGTTPGFLNRVLPLKCPWDDELYCRDVSFSRLGGDLGPDPTLGNWPRCEWIEYACTFAVRDYDVRSDDLAVSAGSELCRYVTRRRKYVYQERRINAYTLKFEGTSESISVPAFVPFNGGELTYTWHMVPAAAVDFAKIDATLGLVNSDTFDPATYFGKRNIGGPFAPETLLFKGFAGEWPTYPMASGEIAYDIPFVFKVNPLGFNKFPQPSTGTFLTGVYRNNTSVKLYQAASFADLFKARTP